MTSNGDEQSLTDDELIARLRKEASAPRPEHDPFMDLPLAEAVTASAEEVYSGQGPLCGDPARKPTTLQAGYGGPSAAPTSCELASGHPGPHRAGFTQSSILHHWHAFEWPTSSYCRRNHAQQTPPMICVSSPAAGRDQMIDATFAPPPNAALSSDPPRLVLLQESSHAFVANRQAQPGPINPAFRRRWSTSTESWPLSCTGSGGGTASRSDRHPPIRHPLTSTSTSNAVADCRRRCRGHFRLGHASRLESSS
jgi:hypothetical protein